jgi:hypothetical protein
MKSLSASSLLFLSGESWNREAHTAVQEEDT